MGRWSRGNPERLSSGEGVRGKRGCEGKERVRCKGSGSLRVEGGSG